MPDKNGQKTKDEYGANYTLWRAHHPDIFDLLGDVFGGPFKIIIALGVAVYDEAPILIRRIRKKFNAASA